MSREGTFYVTDAGGTRRCVEWVTCKRCGTRAMVRAGGQGYCSRACAGSDHLPPARHGAENAQWKGDQAGYVSMHKRVRRLRGKADHCEPCGRTGPGARYEWANLTGHYEDVWDYEQMCKGCHRLYDRASYSGERHHGAKLTEERVRAARIRYQAGETAKSLAAEFGMSHHAMWAAVTGKTWQHVA